MGRSMREIIGLRVLLWMNRLLLHVLRVLFEHRGRFCIHQQFIKFLHIALLVLVQVCRSSNVSVFHFLDDFLHPTQLKVMGNY